MSATPINLYDLTREELTALFARWELSAVHAARLWKYLYWDCAETFAAMTELPAKVHARLTAETRLAVLGTAWFLPAKPRARAKARAHARTRSSAHSGWSSGSRKTGSSRRKRLRARTVDGS